MMWGETAMTDGRHNQKTFTRYMMDGFMDPDVVTGVGDYFDHALFFCVSNV